MTTLSSYLHICWNRKKRYFLMHTTLAAIFDISLESHPEFVMWTFNATVIQDQIKLKFTFFLPSVNFPDRFGLRSLFSLIHLSHSTVPFHFHQSKLPKECSLRERNECSLHHWNNAIQSWRLFVIILNSGHNLFSNWRKTMKKKSNS